MEPFAAGGAALPFGDGQEPAADAGASVPGRDQGVDDEGVGPAVPGHVDEPDQAVGSKAQTQPRLWRSTWLRQSVSSTACAKPSAWSVLTSALANGARHS